MFSFIRLLSAAAVATSLANALVTRVDKTDLSSIFDSIAAVDQKATTPADAVPDQSPPVTVVSAIDGDLTGVDVVNATTTPILKRSPDAELVRRVTRDDFSTIFSGSETDRDCAVEGTSYLTYKLVSNSTYSVGECLDFCAGVDNCVFANLYYEFNNPLLDFVFSEKSNLKCVLFGDFHSSAEKTNCGGQQLQDEPAGKTYMQKSSGYALSELSEPEAPAGFEKVFGPTNGANNAPGYMGYVLLSMYDVDECAHQCDIRDPDASGPCIYFNIWRALKGGNPQSYICAMYYDVADVSTAVNYGQGDIEVTYSRGYKRV